MHAHALASSHPCSLVRSAWPNYLALSSGRYSLRWVMPPHRASSTNFCCHCCDQSFRSLNRFGCSCVFLLHASMLLSPACLLLSPLFPFLFYFPARFYSDGFQQSCKSGHVVSICMAILACIIYCLPVAIRLASILLHCCHTCT